jgi:hypothetical protein
LIVVLQSGGSEKFVDDSRPFRFEAIGRLLLSCLAVPVPGVSQITFRAMQVGMHPRSRAVLDVLSYPVRLDPISIRRMPQSSQNRRDGWRFGVAKSGFEFFDCHHVSIWLVRRSLCTLKSAVCNLFLMDHGLTQAMIEFASVS